MSVENNISRAAGGADHPEVSIILPTYNRADTILRAIDSVRGQTHQDWELIVVDDGSKDGTHELVSHIDPRILVIRQPNAGVGAARNTGLAAARGRFLTFLDSDDAWLPHFLELTAGFLRSTPDAQWVTTEFLQDYGNGHVVKHNLQSVPQYLSFARTIDSKAFDLPAGETDEYLRLYDTKAPAGEWARAALARLGLAAVQVYQGRRLFSHMRWGYLNWLPATMLTRQACETVGPFVTHRRTAEDYRFLALLSKHFQASMIAVPGAVKYERAIGGTALQQGHLATGGNSYAFEVAKLEHFNELYADQFASDPELPLIHSHHEYDAGFAALRLGKRDLALGHLRAAARWMPRLRRAYVMLAVAALAPTDRIAAGTLQGWLRVSDVAGRVLRGETSLGTLAGKLLKPARPARDDAGTGAVAAG